MTMTRAKFTSLMKKRFGEILKVTDRKGKEYARDGALSNFHDAGQFMGCTPERALLGFLTKHLVSIKDLINDIEEGKTPNLEQLQEKTTDNIVYSLLLEALVIENEGKPRS